MVGFCLSLIGGVVTLIVGFRLIHWLMKGFGKSKLFKRLDPTAQPFIMSLANVTLKVLLILVVAASVGVPTASIIAVLGSAGVAVGLALQGSLSNLAGGIMILFYKPFKRGDFIEMGTNPSGTVEDISIFYTTLITVDNRTVVIPNGTLSNGTLVNYSTQPLRRVDVDFSIAYGEDCDKARTAILEAAGGCGLILSEPAPAVYMTKLMDSSVVLQYRGWANGVDAAMAQLEIRERVKKGLDEKGISIPFPQLDVHVQKEL